MDKKQGREFVKNFFEKYYEKLDGECDGIALRLPGIDERMCADRSDEAEEWRKWKLVPSDISEKELDELEEKIGAKMPDILRAFLSTYFHYFEDPVGRNSIDDKFSAVNNAWNPMLVKSGYLPFAWDEEGYFIRCINMNNMPDEDKCEVCQIDHEIMFGFDEDTVAKEEIDENMYYIAENFYDYLNKILDGTLEDNSEDDEYDEDEYDD